MKVLIILFILLLGGCAAEQTIDKIPRDVKSSASSVATNITTLSCMDNLDRFSGTYTLAVKSREVGIQDYSTQGTEICGQGSDFFGDLPNIATITVNGNSGTLSVNINNEWYSGSGIFEGSSAPKKPLVGGTYFETSNSVTPGVNSCGAESPLFTISKKFPEEGGQTRNQQ